MRRRDPSRYLVLTRLFLRQFLQNDLLSPDGDRSQTLAIAGASVISLTLFISMFTSAGYAMSRMMPGEAAVLTLSDKFFYCALAMLVTALAAASQWDALSLDQRDAAILQPLPVPAATVRLAKMTAVAILGSAVAIGVNVFPTFIFPWMLAFAVPAMSAAQLFQMMLIHLMITVTAAVFGYLAVIALRESSSAILGGTLFARVSPWLQTGAIMLVGSALLLLPLTSARVGQRGFSGWRLLLPPTAFVGAYEVATSGFLADLPRPRMTAPQARRDAAATALYAQRRPLFPSLARRAQLLFLAAAALVAGATATNALRMPAITLAGAGRRRRTPLATVARVVFPRRAAARAGFVFAVATLWRHKAHRLTLACAAAIGFAMAMLALSRVDMASDAAPTVRLLVIQPLLYGSLLAGVRHLVRVPAELRANWGIQMAWRGQPRRFMDGVQAAAMLTVVLPALVVAAVPIGFVCGATFAVLHAALGALGAAIVLQALMLSYGKVPFTCPYVPAENQRALAPIYALAFLVGAALFARLQLYVLDGGTTAVIGLVVALIVLRVAVLRRRHNGAMDFNEVPAAAYQQLGLHT